jgi:hypothetical protein
VAIVREGFGFSWDTKVFDSEAEAAAFKQEKAEDDFYCHEIIQVRDGWMVQCRIQRTATLIGEDRR